MLSGAKLPSIQENTAETGVGRVIETAPAPVFLLFGSEIGVLLFAFLYGAKKLAKLQPTGFEYENVKSVAEKGKKDFVNQQNLCCNIW